MNTNDFRRLREKFGIQMHANELFAIAKVIKKSCNFLIFGVGNDSILWHNLNKKGVTVFIEDNKKWFERITEKYPFLQIIFVNYGTKRSDWECLLNNPKNLFLDLPEKITKIKWDVILVDGPKGYKDQDTGRMKSIFMASKLIKRGGDVFVHDCDREVEKNYCDRFFDKNDLIKNVEGRAILRHYKTKNLINLD